MELKSMGKFIGILLLCFILPGISWCIYARGITTIKNPSKPKNVNAGKVLILKEVLRITDDSEDFYFKFPSNVKIAPDSSIFVLDDKQLLRFDANGKFCKNFFKEGQGPMEQSRIDEYFLINNQLVINDTTQDRIIILDYLTGNLIKEYRLPVTKQLAMVTHFKNDLYFSSINPRDTKGKMIESLMDLKFILSLNDGKEFHEKGIFPLSFLHIKAGDQFLYSKRVKFLSCKDEADSVYISHTADYLIKEFNFKSQSIVRTFSREYPRARVTEANKKYAPGGNFGQVSVDGKQWFKVPIPEYFPDIQKLFWFNNNLWVITSTIVDEKMILVDVFNRNGVYIDNFYLDCPKNVIPYQVNLWIYCVAGNYLYARQETEEGDMSLVKYQVMGVK